LPFENSRKGKRLPRSGARSEKAVKPKIPADPSLLGRDLTDWAGPHIGTAGRREALLGRVELLRLAADGRSIEARVRGNRPLPYRVTVSVGPDDLVGRCTCAKEASAPCKHAVAALEALRFPRQPAPGNGGASPRRRGGGRSGRGRGRIVQPAVSQPGFLVLGGSERTLTREERVALAREEELALRRQRARRSRAKVEPLPGDGGPPGFVVSPKGADGGSVVTLRGPKAREGSCGCTDFLENELGSCVHVERARIWYSRKKKQIPEDLLSLWWRPRVWADRVPDPLREIRADLPAGGAIDSLQPFFDEEGWLGEPPDGRPGHAWAAEAVDAARSLAGREGWRLDLDPAVEQRILEAAEEETLSARLSRITPENASWRAVVKKLGFTLHPYQEVGSLFLAGRGRALLADEMGLGKTVQAIAASLLLRREAGARKALIVCPASLKHQWKREIDKACGERALVMDGPRASRLVAYAGWREGFLVLNYELVLRDLEEIRAAGADLVILDEAQRIKNWDTKTARAVKMLPSRFAFILTGTPLENRLTELHSLVEFLHPRALGPRWRLLPFHAVTEAPGKVIAYEGLEVLRGRLSEFFLRRDRREVLDQLPERTDNTFWIGMTPLQRRPYRKHAATVAALLSRNQALMPGEIRIMLQALTSMRILCNAHAQYDWPGIVDRLRDGAPPARGEIKALGSPKLEEFARVLEDLLDESETKIVVFSQWERALRLAHFVVRDLLERKDLRGELFYGGLNSKAREQMLDAFRLDPEFRVLFSTDAGGLGLNLQEAASIVVNLEVPWNPAVLDQRIGRVHRMGQRRGVQVLHFVTRGAVEERVRQVVESKRALFEGLLAEDVDSVVFDEESRASLVQRVRGLIGDSDARGGPG
jgi:superfamily II DNA or RNA helicase